VSQLHEHNRALEPAGLASPNLRKGAGRYSIRFLFIPTFVGTGPTTEPG